MLKLSNTQENVDEVNKGKLLWQTDKGVLFCYTKHGIVMKTPYDMFVVSQNEYVSMRNGRPEADMSRRLHG
jgi:hypothetical protein